MIRDTIARPTNNAKSNDVVLFSARACVTRDSDFFSPRGREEIDRPVGSCASKFGDRAGSFAVRILLLPGTDKQRDRYESLAFLSISRSLRVKYADVNTNIHGRATSVQLRANYIFRSERITNSQSRIQFATSALRMVSDLLPEPLRLACILNIDYNTSPSLPARSLYPPPPMYARRSQLAREKLVTRAGRCYAAFPCTERARTS